MIMSEENQEMEQQFVEIYGEDGQIVKCEIYDVIDFEDKTYALLLPVTEDEEDEVIVGEIEEGVKRNQVLIGDGDEDDDFEFL